MKYVFLILALIAITSCSVKNTKIIETKNNDCIENGPFKKEFYRNVKVIDSLIIINQNEEFNKSLKFISTYAPVTSTSRLNYNRSYPYGIYEKDRKTWIEWYERSKCNNIQLKK